MEKKEPKKKEKKEKKATKKAKVKGLPKNFCPKCRHALEELVGDCDHEMPW